MTPKLPGSIATAIPRPGISASSQKSAPRSTNELLAEIVSRLERIERHLKVPPPPPGCDFHDCQKAAVDTMTSGHPPVTRRWCREHSPGMRGLTTGLTSY